MYLLKHLTTTKSERQVLKELKQKQLKTNQLISYLLLKVSLKIPDSVSD